MPNVLIICSSTLNLRLRIDFMIILALEAMQLNEWKEIVICDDMFLIVLLLFVKKISFSIYVLTNVAVKAANHCCRLQKSKFVSD